MGAAAGYPYAPFNSGMPPEVEQLARAGKTLEAMKLYREVTGASFEQAKAAVTVL
jgi:ribosomal protein L7/L12